jgi:hypothetical protein
MPATRRALTAAVAACALSLATAAPGLARPGGHGPARPCVGCDTTAAAAVPGTSGRDSESPRTSSLAGTVDPRAGVVAAAAPATGADAPDEGGGATTLAVILIAGGALLAGGGAGFAGARRVGVRTT